MNTRRASLWGLLPIVGVASWLALRVVAAASAPAFAVPGPLPTRESVLPTASAFPPEGMRDPALARLISRHAAGARLLADSR